MIKNVNFDKKAESKMENSTHSLRETKLVLQLTRELQIKSKTMMSWRSWKKREDNFCIIYFVRRKFFKICALSQQIFSIYTLLQIKKHYFLHFLLVSKIVESLQCILNHISFIFCLKSFKEKHLFRLSLCILLPPKIIIYIRVTRARIA